jgi:hypothetical protein
MADVLPEFFCWTRFGTEAGEAIEQILARKEGERRANNGVFYWGIGNSVGPGIAELVEQSRRPEVLFSPIKSRPRLEDVSPALVVRWRGAESLDGSRFELPKAVCITSRITRTNTRAVHYALVCHSERPLQVSDGGRLRFRDLRNLRSGNALGSSQVTAVVERVPEDSSDDASVDYPVALRTELVAPYFVRLRDAVPVTRDETGSAQAA